MDYITINGKSIPYPNDFTMKRVENIVAEIVTLDGTTIGDVNGWKYENTTLSWDTLVENDLLNLLDALSDHTFDVTFKDLDNSDITVLAMQVSRVNTKTRFKQGGKIIWKNIEVELAFPECYH